MTLVRLGRIVAPTAYQLSNKRSKIDDRNPKWQLSVLMGEKLSYKTCAGE